MALQRFSEELLAKLSFGGEMESGRMIRDVPPARLSAMTRDSASSSLGQLDILPPELLLQTCHFLDFRSLYRFSRVCLRAKAAVEDLPAYKDMIEYVPDVLTALGATRLIGRHPAGLLRRTLRTSRCLSCGAFGAFLFLPTCERACIECLEQNFGLRVTTPAVAKESFRLTPAQLKRIPTMRSLPGVYGPIGADSHLGAYRLVSVKEAKQVSIEVHGSAEAVAKLWVERPSGVSVRLFELYGKLLEAPLGRFSSKTPGPMDLYEIEDAYYGMASMRFPFVTRAGAEQGCACRGCQFLFSQYVEGALPGAIFSEVEEEEDRIIRANASRLQANEEFREHVYKCYGVGLLLERGGFSE